MTPEKINQIFKDVRELREWYEDQKHMSIGRQNGKSTGVAVFVKNIAILCFAIDAVDKCSVCAHFGTRLCAECVHGCDTDYFQECQAMCERCGSEGILGKGLIRHNQNGEEIILCDKCHIVAHMKGREEHE